MSPLGLGFENLHTRESVPAAVLITWIDLGTIDLNHQSHIRLAI